MGGFGVQSWVYMVACRGRVILIEPLADSWALFAE
jgi:hypothetical protein